MNSMKLKDKLKNISKEKNIDFNTLLRLYMYDRLIERLSISKYKDNFVLKGGFYLSTLFGIENRFTMDIDALFKNADFNEITITKMLKEIISIKLDDNVKLSYMGISLIRDEDQYVGFRTDLLAEIDNIKEKFHIDIVTGYLITPKEISYKYKPLLKENYINIWAYNIETVLAEKFETILSRLELNGRMRDFYDIYLIYTKDWNNININNFRKAITNTFNKREYNSDISKSLDIIRKSVLLRKRWNVYRKKYAYAKDITFDEIIECLDKILEMIIPISI